MRPKVRFLTVVWGDAYIERFANLALPSFLAPGNLPALAAACDLEVVIMTTLTHVPDFEAHAAFRALRQVCPVRFVEIDDLIAPGIYGVTLTLAYMRAIAGCGTEMVNSHFMFMNADFVLADGSLRSVCGHILAGRSIILGPSFRSTAEAIEPQLRARANRAAYTLAIPSRELVAIALGHPHPTTLAKTLNQRLCHSREPNQFFWRVDDNTVLGRYYLIFMLCLKPERVVTGINCYCDYSFIPEMCPSGDEVAMHDSDDFFMLEFQRRDQEMDYLRFGPTSEESIAESLSQWTTAEHRRAAKHDILFHASELPASIEKAKSLATEFIDRLDSKLGPPVSHIGHLFWVSALSWFASIRVGRGLPLSPPELSEVGLPEGWATARLQLPQRSRTGTFPKRMGALLSLPYFLQRIVLTAYRLVLGAPPTVTALSPHWVDYLHLRKAMLERLADEQADLLVICERRDLIEPLVEHEKRVRVTTVTDILLRGFPVASSARSGARFVVFVYLRYDDLKDFHRIIEVSVEALPPVGEWYVFVHRPTAAIAETDLLSEIVLFLERAIGYSDASIRSTAGGYIKVFINSLWARMGAHYLRFGVLSLLWVVPTILVCLPMTLASNLYFRRKLFRECSADSNTSVLIQMH
jgi:hypothetical protein